MSGRSVNQTEDTKKALVPHVQSRPGCSGADCLLLPPASSASFHAVPEALGDQGLPGDYYSPSAPFPPHGGFRTELPMPELQWISDLSSSRLSAFRAQPSGRSRLTSKAEGRPALFNLLQLRIQVSAVADLQCGGLGKLAF